MTGGDVSTRINGHARDRLLPVLILEGRLSEQEATDLISAADADPGKWKTWQKIRVRRDGATYSAEY